MERFGVDGPALSSSPNDTEEAVLVREGRDLC